MLRWQWRPRLGCLIWLPARAPAAQIFRGGKVEAPSDYGGPRDAAGIVAYLEKATAPPSKELNTAEEARR